MTPGMAYPLTDRISRIPPSYTATAGISYRHPSGLYGRIDMRAKGETSFYDDANRTFVEEDAYAVF